MEWTGILAFTVPISLAIAYCFRHYRKSDEFTTNLNKKRLKEAEDYIKDLEADIKSVQNKLNRQQVGPKVEGTPAELKDLIPELIPEFEQYAPTWMKPFLKDKNIQGWLIDYALKNPDKATGWFGRFLKKPQSENQPEAGQPVPEAL